MRVAEAEFVFCLATALTAGAAPHTSEQVLAAVAALHLATKVRELR